MDFMISQNLADSIFYLKARIARNVDGLDIQLYERVLHARRAFFQVGVNYSSFPVKFDFIILFRIKFARSNCDISDSVLII